MKFRLFALMLALSLVVWAQENPSASAPNATPAQEKSCCHHAATATNAKDAGGCCHHAAKAGDAKAVAECCGKDKCEMKGGKSCCNGKAMADGKSCCDGKDMKKCAKECAKTASCAEGKCCGQSGDKSAMNCCGSKCEHGAQATSASLLDPRFDRR